MKLTPGKLAGLKAVSNEKGVIAAAAMDQRGSLQKSLAKEKGSAITGRHDGGIQDAGERGADTARQRDSARPGVGPARLQAPRQECRLAAGLRKDRLRQDRTRTPRRSAEPLVRQAIEGSWSAIASRFCSTTLRSTRKKSTTRNTPGSSASATSAAPTTFRSFWSLSATKKAPTKRAWNTPRRSRRLSPKACASSAKPRYGVDVLKVEVPVNMKFVEGTKSFAGEKAYTKKEAIDLFHKRCQCGHQAVYLSFGRCQQRGIQRDPRTGRRIGREVQRRSLRTRDLERRHSDLRQTGRRCVPQVARNRRREEYQQREWQAEGRHVLAFDVRSGTSAGSRVIDYSR